MSLSTGIIRERIEDREGGWAKAKREPRGSRRFP
jgi:hypothetical protein